MLWAFGQQKAEPGLQTLPILSLAGFHVREELQEDGAGLKLWKSAQGAGALLRGRERIGPNRGQQVSKRGGEGDRGKLCSFRSFRIWHRGQRPPGWHLREAQGGCSRLRQAQTRAVL